MKKNLFLAALAFVALASCTSDEFVGENTSPTTSNTAGAIQFGSNASKITRATSNTGSVAEMLDRQFKVYGTKNVKENNSDVYSIVFPGYVAWSNNTVTTSNPDGTLSDPTKGWEYVGSSGQTYGTTTTAGTLSSEQTIKYWDYAADNYHFVAGSPVSSFSISLTGDISTATVSGLAGHINANTGSTAISTNPVYISKPVNVVPDNYAKPVKLEFVRQQSKVRVGVFETIPGYDITEIKFYTCTAGTTPTWTSPTTSSTQNIILGSATANYFVGGSSASATVTYNWSGNESGVTYPNYTFTYDDSGLTKSNNWYGGCLNGVKAITSNHSNVSELFGTDGDMESSTGYFTVIPTPSGTPAAPILIKCDYILEPVNRTSEGSTETITIHGATAAVPAAFSKWAPNTSYTYLFKISDNTNGVTSTSHTDKVGLFPITFDAVAVAEATGTEQGTITTVSIPSITTYQVGSVVDVVNAQNPDNSKHGIEYKAGKEIYLTVQNNETGELNTLKTDGTAGTVHVYKLNSAMTEADLQVTPPSSSGDLFSLCSTATTVEVTVGSDTYKTVTLPANQHGKFTPSEEGYYAIQYVYTAAVNTTPAVYAYKVVYVNPAS